MVRFKCRYVVLELVYEDDKTDLSLTTRDLLNALRDIIQTIHGEFGAAQVRHLSAKYLNVHSRTAVVKCGIKSYRTLLSAMPFVRHLRRLPCTVRSLRLAGTLRSCQKFIAKRNVIKLKECLEKCITPVERRRVEEILNDSLKIDLGRR
ncbi:ribonuclease P/MRP protein subunit POP5-like [Oscarella lobularis]|uniref:ribonuclease P/MRP protein subunit POP5-like n=1 Tax=Oscarella lobularis TaxID=121494 RepID=UPI003313654C